MVYDHSMVRKKIFDTQKGHIKDDGVENMIELIPSLIRVLKITTFQNYKKYIFEYNSLA